MPILPLIPVPSPYLILAVALLLSRMVGLGFDSHSRTWRFGLISVRRPRNNGAGTITVARIIGRRPCPGRSRGVALDIATGLPLSPVA